MEAVRHVADRRPYRHRRAAWMVFVRADHWDVGRPCAGGAAFHGQARCREDEATLARGLTAEDRMPRPRSTARYGHLSACEGFENELCDTSHTYGARLTPV